MTPSTPDRGGSTQPARRLPSPTPDAPRFLFSVQGIRYEAIRELVRMQTGELLLLTRRRQVADGALSGLCLVRRLPNPSTYLRRKRLMEEVQLAFRLNHPGIAQVYFRKVHEDFLHVVMEHVDGPSLETLVSAGVARGRPVSESFGLYVGAELAEALHHAHTLTDEEGRPLGIIHRDVNPRHVYVGAHGGVKLTNFGAAYSVMVGREESPMNLVRGDVAYASPEYLEKQPLSPRSDVFSLGVLLVELLTGKHLFDVQDVSFDSTGLPPLQIEVFPSLPLTQMRILLARFSPADVEAAVAGLSPDVKALLHTALRADPTERFATASEMRDALRAALARRHPGYGRHEASKEVATVLAEGGGLRDAVEFGEGGLFPEGLEAHEFGGLPPRK
ncbi:MULTISPECIES: serine/threonine-protein kinase [unclassified Corallococcus]|uniref:serine/threonine-protein kinase n=1 Tax=unclassified Corallococcus TaxID=2685029 RepID=UPI001A8DF5D4|nr:MULTISPECIES: serine/threonine-protein kinase [unclassified Corallococcus]MBN9685239.1 serine/threonine protein kinase [Corallococcus sp. NCSPR001]WAS83305.1 serine/threonine-protein kinase [Corallococcus sp. NCRR]